MPEVTRRAYEQLSVDGRDYAYVGLRGALADAGLPEPERLPASLLVLLEGLLRQCGGAFDAQAVAALRQWLAGEAPRLQLPWRPMRVLLQDYTGIPVLVDLAALREAARREGLDAGRFACHVPTDLVVDHSLVVDHAASAGAAAANSRVEAQRNSRRFDFLRWAAESVRGLRVFPAGSGICHQINMEQLASVVALEPGSTPPLLRPDSVLGADSHTTTINGLGVLGWGVGGIEALSALLGHAQSQPLPQVVGVHLGNRLPPHAGATDLVLSLTELLRREGVVGCFVEFHGPGVGTLSATDRATVSNMAPEAGATCAFFAVDSETLRYLRQTCRSEHQVALVEAYCRAQGLWRDATAAPPRYSRELSLDLAGVEPCVAGPSRPEQTVRLSRLPEVARQATPPAADAAAAPRPRDGDVVLAAITSCTNTANPHSMLAAGLLARNAVRRGLRAQPWVKTSLAPGSRVVADYLHESGLQPFLDQLGFQIVGFGCTTCIGNSGPLLPQVAQALQQRPTAVAAVLSGNRNFAYRVHPQVQANYLASPALVVAFALLGTTHADLEHEVLGIDPQGQPVRLRDIWPSREAIDQAVRAWVRPQLYAARQAAPRTAQQPSLRAAAADPWDIAPSYVARPPLLELEPPPPHLPGARILASYGDGLTTDQISPAAPIQPHSAAAQLLQRQGVAPQDLHSFGARRGNWQVMLQGAFGNPSARNELLQPPRAGQTPYPPGDQVLSIQEAARRYAQQGVPLLIVAGRNYGVGSSRDDAAKSTRYLGVRAVIAQSFERIHRANLLALGVLPLVFPRGHDRQSLRLDAASVIDLDLRQLDFEHLEVPMRIHGSEQELALRACIESPEEYAHWRAGGLLPWLLQQALAQASSTSRPR